MRKEIKRATGLLVIEVVQSNVNGDYDEKFAPCQATGGIDKIFPMSFQRKLLDLLEDHDSLFFKNLPKTYVNNGDHYQILDSRQRKGTSFQRGKIDKEKMVFQSAWARNYWDARVFGNTSPQGGTNIERLLPGVVQFGVGTPISPVTVMHYRNEIKPTIQKRNGLDMAPFTTCVIEHGVYCMPFFITPIFARRTGCTAKDIELLKILIPKAYELNRSVFCSDIRIRHAWYIEHLDALGTCPDFLLIEALTPTRMGDTNDPSTSWADYCDKTHLPAELMARVSSVVDLVRP